ncbi:uncharacterized protein LOC131931218 isoform X2 [Physella acuta]|uniref:uncharacterized protein LOC131931218 isoform X2 n=1 Tax=Physella acuta TaxID=109671 RepID=UPI0027DC48DD|nr:uncharacterized protein LOC131931218 isoform X2 [Physella acuta]
MDATKETQVARNYQTIINNIPAASVQHKFLNVLFFGPPGQGKTSTINYLLDQSSLAVSVDDEIQTTNVQTASGRFRDYYVKCVDFPGVRGNPAEEDILVKHTEHLERVCRSCPKGIHAVAIVLKFGNRFYEEDEYSLQMLKELFGESYLETHGTCIVTHGDVFEANMRRSPAPKSFSQWCQDQKGVWEKFFKACNYNCVMLDNLSDEVSVKQAKVQELLAASTIGWNQPAKSISPQLRALADMHLLVEVGSSEESYRKQLTFLVRYLQDFDPRYTSIMITGRNKTHFYCFKTFDNHAELQATLHSTEYLEPCRTTEKSLLILRKESFGARAGMRPDVKQVALMLTEGRTEDEAKLARESENLRHTGAKLMVVGVSCTDRHLLEMIAADPEDVFMAEDYEELQAFPGIIKHRTCELAPKFQCAADILIMIDASSSIGSVDYKKELDFVIKLTETFNLGPTAATFSVIVFSSFPKIISSFDITSHTGIKEIVSEAPYQSQSTDTAAALRMARTKAFTPSNCVRQDAKKIVFVLTDGESNNPDETAEEAELLKQTGTMVMAVGVAGAKIEELKKIASFPENVYYVSSFDLLQNLLEEVAGALCKLERMIDEQRRLERELELARLAEEQRLATLKKKEEDRKIVDDLIENLLATSLKQDDINLLFVGPSGSGKSHCSNAILGSSLKSQHFTTQTSSVNVCTSRYEKYDVKIVECNIASGLDIDCACADVLPQVLKSCPKGIHVPVLVLRLEQSVIQTSADFEMQILKRSFGDEYLEKYGVCIVSSSDGSGPLASGFDEWCRQQNDAAKNIFEAFNYRCVYFCDGNKGQQVPEFMSRVMSGWPQPTNTVSVNPETRVYAEMNVVVQSASSAEAFHMQMQFVSQYTGDYSGSEVKACVTVVGQSQHARIGAIEFETHQEFERALMSTPFLGHCPGLHRALEAAKKESIAASKDRPEVKKMAVVLNNGDYDDEDEAVEEAAELKKVVSEVMVVSVGSTNQRKLEKIASSPDSVFIAADETELIHKCTEQVKHRTCEIELKIEEQRLAMLKKKEEDRIMVDSLIENLLATSMKQDDINMLFVGPSGSGKSHCSNAILGSSLKCHHITTQTSSVNVCSSKYEKYDVKIVECNIASGLDIDCACVDVLPHVLKSCPKGIHVPVIVLRLEQSVIQTSADFEMQVLKRCFGDEYLEKYGVCIVSSSDGSGPLANGFDEWCRQQNDAAKRIFEAFNYRCVYFCDVNKGQQVPEFMSRVLSCWPQPTNTVSVIDPETRVYAEMNVVVQSASSAEAFHMQMQFVSQYTGDYSGSEVKACVTVVGQSQHTRIGAIEFETHQEFERALMSTPFLGHCPGLHRALEAAKIESIAASKDRPEVKKMAIVLNNGDYDDEDEAVEEATELKKVVSEVMVVSVGSTNQRKLEKIASSPDSVFIAADETELIHKCTEQVKQRTCEIELKIEEQRLAMLKKKEEDRIMVDGLIENLLATSMKQDDINMLFVGPSGSGKSHCSNAILGSSLKSQHITTQTSSVNVCTSLYEKYDVKIVECSTVVGADIDCACAEVLPFVLKSCPKGIHVPVIVMRLEQSVIQTRADFEMQVLKRCFGDEYLEKYGVCIVSSSDGSGPLASDFDEWCHQQNDAAKRIFEAFNYRCVYFCDVNKDQQVPEFMSRVMSCWPQPTNTVSVTPETRVYAEMNVVVQSASSAEAFHMQMQFVSQYTGDYSGSEVKACVTVVGQSQHARIGAMEFETHQEFERALMSTPFLGHCPGLHRALEAAKMESIAASKDRPEVKKMAVVLNNGDYDDEDEAVEEAAELKKVVSEVMVVSVGSTNQRKLEKIASSPDSVFIAADETELIHKCTEQVKHRTCEIEQKIKEQRQAILKKKADDKRIVDGLIENLPATSLKQDDINMLFVGPSGSGKTHCSNAILGSSLKSQHFTTQTSSVNVCSSKYEKYDVKIVECTVKAGLDIDCACADVLTQVLKSCPKGIHVPVLVLHLEQSVLKIDSDFEMQVLKRSFGDDFLKNNGLCIVSSSDGSGPLASGFDEWCRQQNDVAKKIFEAFNYRCVYFSYVNKDQQVPEFMSRVMSCWPQPTNTVSVNPQMRASADVDVIVQSASTAEAFQQQMQFVSKYTGDYDRSEVKASVTVVGKDQHKCIGASEYDTHQEFETALVTTPFLGHCSGLHRALEVARKESIAASTDRPEVKKMAVVLNNGDYDDEDEAVEEATELKKVVSEVMVVSVGSTNQRKLEKIASSPDSVFIAADETELIHKCTEQVKHRTCEIAPQYSSTANICFLIDSSGSIGLDYHKELNFVVGLTELFNIGMEAAQFSAMIYSNDVRVLFNFESLTHEEIKEKVLGATFIGQGTNTAEALKTARVQTFPTTDSTRQNNTKIAIVITDGQSQNTNQTYQEAEALIAAGVRTMAIGVGAGAVMDELRKIACRANYVYSVDGFNVLQTVHDEIARLTSHLGADTDSEIQEYRRSLPEV